MPSETHIELKWRLSHLRRSIKSLLLTQHVASISTHEAYIHTLLAVLPDDGIDYARNMCVRCTEARCKLGLPVTIRHSAACVQPSISSAEGVPSLPVMIGLHATLYPELDVRTGASPSLRRSLRQGTVYDELSLSLSLSLASRRSRASKLSDFRLFRGA